jgi:hypothetical protein
MDTTEARIPVGTWADFFAAYESAHRDPMNRWVHHLTHFGAAAGLVLAVRGHLLVGGALVALAFPLNALAHRVFEGNAPALRAPSDAWGKAQVALGGIAWTAVTLWSDGRALFATR